MLPKTFNPRVHSGWFLGFAVVLISVLVGGVLATRADGQDDTHFGWTVVDQRPALARNGAIIRIGGTGTFVAGDPEEVKGGGTWTTFNASGMQTGSGNFEVTRLVKFDVAPGLDPDAPNIRAGLAFLHVAYSDDTDGILVVSCNLGANPPPGVSTPPDVTEGFSASKGFTFYFDGYKGPAFFTQPPPQD